MAEAEMAGSKNCESRELMVNMATADEMFAGVKETKK